MTPLSPSPTIPVPVAVPVAEPMLYIFVAALIALVLGVYLGASFRSLVVALRLTGPTYILASGIVVLVGMLIAESWRDNPLAFSIGTSVAATGLASLFMYLYAANQRGQISRQEAFSRFGLDAIFDGRGAAIRDQYEDRLRSAKRHIDALGFGMHSLLQDHFDDFAAWKERAHVRILLVDPEYPTPDTSFASRRDAEEQNASGEIAVEVRSFLERTRSLRGQSKRGSFEVKLYRTIPTVNVFRIDDVLYWGPYLINRPSRNAPTLRLLEGGLLYRRLLQHFDDIWNDASLSVDAWEAKTD